MIEYGIKTRSLRNILRTFIIEKNSVINLA